MKKDILVVSSYPKQGEGHSRSTVGGASYTKKLLESLALITNSFSPRVLSEQHGSSRIYTENGVHIEPVWTRGNLLSLLNLALSIVLRPESRKVLSLEVYMFGSLLYVPLMLISFFLARLKGNKTIVILHQVPEDLSGFGIGSTKTRVFNAFINLYYKALKLAFTRVIVFESALGSRIGTPDRIDFLPHMIFDEKFPGKADARDTLGLSQSSKYTLFFGYLAPYKGLDSLIRLWPTTGAETLIIAGDTNPNHKHHKKINEYKTHIKLLAQGKKILFTGFVPEELISYYFAATDTVVLPYTTFMSSSGPLAFALSAKKPTIFSSVLKPYLKSPDFYRAMNTSGVNSSQLFFHSTEKSLANTLKYAYARRGAFLSFAQKLKQFRAPESVAQQFLSIIENL